MDINERKALSFGAFSVCGSLGKVEGGEVGGGVCGISLQNRMGEILNCRKFL